MSSSPKAKKGIVFRQEEEGAFLFNPDTGAIKVLNQTGAFIWQLLGGKKTTSQIAQQVIKQFEGSDVKQAAEDLKTFLEELKKLALIE